MQDTNAVSNKRSEATARPWKYYSRGVVEEDGTTIAECSNEAIAAHIVQCVNVHDALVEALENIITQYDRRYGFVHARKVLNQAKGATT